MSASRTIIFYGLRYEFSADYLDVLDRPNGDPRVVAAEEQRLDVYYARFGGVDELHYLFVGKNLGSVGIEDSDAKILSKKELNEVFVMIDQRLNRAGFSGDAAIFIQFQHDL